MQGDICVEDFVDVVSEVQARSPVAEDKKTAERRVRYHMRANGAIIHTFGPAR